MNNGKLQAKQEKLKSLHCPSTQSFLFNSRDSLLRSQLCSLVSHSPAPNPEQSAKSPSFSSQHNSKCATPSLQNSDELGTPSQQQLFIDMSTELLRRGQSVRFRAPGLSMHPAIREGETITVAPISPFNIKRGDILLYIVGKKVIAHRVVGIEREKSDSSSHTSTQSKALNPQIIFTLRGDASAICDEPVEAEQVLGKVVSVERHGRSIDLYSRKARMLHIAYTLASHLKRLILSILRPWGQAPKTFKAKVRI
ncbi:hypothetical protein LCGC14_1029990 [marine sediment metagenome]|uniref:Peptidase S24/S26A/S26B/S26C domain-containing protein n=1 Tax=marine sediment metagenome TaxID=412755 RepID=A0A0F9MUW4_9ZZZZ